jgi:dihydrolipoamide dehydrogenase
MSKGVQFLMKKNKIEVINGFGKLKSKGVVEVKAADGSTKKIPAKASSWQPVAAPRIT